MSDDRLLVAVDVDGTLLNVEFDDDLAAPEREAVRRVRAAGHVLALCTGRNRQSAARVIESADGALDGAPRILLNGAVVLDGERVLREAHLGREMLAGLTELFKSHGVLPGLFTDDDENGGLTIESVEPNSVLAGYLERRGARVGPVRYVDDLRGHLPASALEIGSIDEQGVIEALSADVRATYGDRVQVVNTQTLLSREPYLWIEVYAADCTKGSGLTLLAGSYGVPRERIVAIGDNYNDLDMFTAAGHRVAMGNAPADVRAAADRVAPPVSEHGAATVLEEIAAGLYPRRET